MACSSFHGSLSFFLRHASFQYRWTGPSCAIIISTTRVRNVPPAGQRSAAPSHKRARKYKSWFPRCTLSLTLVVWSEPSSRHSLSSKDQSRSTSTALRPSVSRSLSASSSRSSATVKAATSLFWANRSAAALSALSAAMAPMRSAAATGADGAAAATGAARPSSTPKRSKFSRTAASLTKRAL